MSLIEDNNRKTGDPSNRMLANNEELVASISGGTALHGLCFGMGDVLSKQAPQPVLKKTASCSLMQPSMPARIATEYFQSKEEGDAFSKAVTENGYSYSANLKAKGFVFDLNGNADYNEAKRTTITNRNERKFTSISMSQIHFYPMRSFRHDVNRLELSENALTKLRGVKDSSSARTFLLDYGSHIACDLHHVGGILFHSVTVSTTEQQSMTSLESMARNEFTAAASLGYGSFFQAEGNYARTNSQQNESQSSSCTSKTSSRFHCYILGPGESADPAKFQELLRRDSSSWYIIDRGSVWESLVPIWKIVSENHSELGIETNAADLLCQAWLAASAQVANSSPSSSNIDIVNQMRAKALDWKNGAPRKKELHHSGQLIDQIQVLAAVELKTIEGGRFFVLLEEYFKLVSVLERDNESSDGMNGSSNDPWVQYVSNQPEVRGLLKQLAENQDEYQHKFASVYALLSNKINDSRLRKMELAGYKLDDDICDMLRRQEEPHRSYEQQTVLDYQPNPTTNVASNVDVGNLADVLTDELQRFTDDLDHVTVVSSQNAAAVNFQKRIEKTLGAVVGHPTPTLSGLAKHVLDFLVVECRWNEQSKFEGTMTTRTLQTVIDGIRSLHRNCDIEKQFKVYPYSQLPIPNPDRVESLANSKGKKKTYADILIDQPFSSAVAIVTGSAQDLLKRHANHLMYCLRHRTEWPDLLLVSSSDVAQAGAPGAGPNRNKWKVKKSSTTNKPLPGTPSCISLYDTLLRLLDNYDAAGAVEIARLLTERRSAIPLVVPQTKQHHLPLLNHVSVTSFEGILMGQDVMLTRIAVVSCRNKKQSQTSELIKSLFHMDSVHFHDFKKKHITSKNVAAEIGCGCLLMGDSNGQRVAHHLLVVHVVGDFRPLWPFLAKFADYILIEDATHRKGSFCPTFLHQNPTILQDMIRVDTDMNDGAPFVCVWKSSTNKPDDIKCLSHGGLRYGFIEGQFGSTTQDLLTSEFFSDALKESRSKTRLPLDEISSVLEAAGYTSHLVSSRSIDVQSAIANEATELSQVKKEQFLLQQYYQEEARYEETLYNRQVEKTEKWTAEHGISLWKHKRRFQATFRVLDLKTTGPSLLQLLLNSLTDADPSNRILSLRALEKTLAERSDRELAPLKRKVKMLYDAYMEKTEEARVEAAVKELQNQLKNARMELNEGVVSIEHLWRELSHYYAAVKPEHRPPLVADIPRLAAQHMMDGFSIELLDGDSSRFRSDWVTQVLRELQVLIGGRNKGRLFVLSVIGVQSSGKSTLLNTMFGIQMRTSVGQCTRGVNMQLLKVEGRAEYDYILLLDTEGCRSPIFHGLPGSEKRDNQMAALSILLADATIVTINGEDVAAIKDILPIVQKAYQGSQLAEENGGRHSSHMFFLFNRIDTTKKEKLDGILINLGTSLAKAAREVSISSGTAHAAQAEGQADASEIAHHGRTSQTPFANFKLKMASGESADDGDSDVFFTGSVKVETEPPNDVPNPSFGKSLIDFRELIHRRVTGARGENGQGTWRSHSLDELSKYAEMVWEFICSADFTLTFASVMEYNTLDRMDSEYNVIERDLTTAYREEYDSLYNEMINAERLPAATDLEAGFEIYKEKLENQMFQRVNQMNETLAEMVKKKGRAKWDNHYKMKWETCKTNQADNWDNNLKMVFNSIFGFERHVDNYKKKMRNKINQLFSQSESAVMKQQQQQENTESFEGIYQGIVDEAEMKFPPREISDDVEKVYDNHHEIFKLNSDNAKQKNASPEAEKALCQEFIRNAEAGKLRDDVRSGPHHGISDKKYYERITKLLTQGLTALWHYFTGKNKLSTKVVAAFTSVYKAIKTIVATEICYNDNIVSNVIRSTAQVITEMEIDKASEIRRVHLFGRMLITQLMEDIQRKWEAENSVAGKLRQRANKEELRHYFDLVSRGYRKTRLFAGHMVSILKNNIDKAFQEEMVWWTLYHATEGIRNERWQLEVRKMHNHMDLYLTDLLLDNQVDQVLDYVRNPQDLYRVVLSRLIQAKVPDVRLKWIEFVKDVKDAIGTATAFSASVNQGKVEQFVAKLKAALALNPSLKNKILAQAFSAISADEFQDCDQEETMTFIDTCKWELDLLFQQLKPPTDQKEFAEKLCPKVIDAMKMDKDPTILPRCDACCRMCKSMCIKPMNHDPASDKHDAIHQPGGVAGVSYHPSDKLCATSCSQSFENDSSFYLDGNYSVEYKYRDFDKVFKEWKNPRAHENWPLRKYILKTYNKEIANKYGLKPCEEIPDHFHSLDLKEIRRDLESATQQ